MIHRQGQKNSRLVYAIDYRGSRILVGSNWPQICKTIDITIVEPKIVASVKLTLYERLKQILKLTPVDLEKLLQQYSDSLWLQCLYFKSNMKQAPTYSRNELLLWINGTLSKEIDPVRKIEELGNGVAYLLLLNHLKAGSIRTEKIIKKPTAAHQIMSNLKMLSVAFEKLAFEYKIEIEKLAQMKYQDNFYLASFFYRMFKQANENKQDNQQKNQPEKNNNLKKIRIIPPENPPTIKYPKERPPDITKQDFIELEMSQSHKKLREIQTTMEENASNKEKLNKIATILQIRNHKEKPQGQQQPHHLNSVISIQPMTVEESYKRLLRDSVCKKSKYLSMFANNSFVTSNSGLNNEEPKQMSADEEMKLLLQKQKYQHEAEGQMLLSNHKQNENHLQNRKQAEGETPSEITAFVDKKQDINEDKNSESQFQHI